ncbi:MAG: LysE family transporter [Bacteroidota bacterium]|nr:LysE family transporter [Bacteroidota bacterium]
MLDIFIKGVLIGLCISVPLGPIGMLTIQRTLNRGQKYGIATGLGATTSDLIYTIITLFFLSFVLDFIEEHRFVIELLGSTVVAIFGWYIFNSNPATQPKPNETSKHSLFGDFMTSFGLTLSNPLVLFVLIALFARFQFIGNKTTLWVSIIGILSILGGAFLWWNTLTFLVSRFKNKLNMRELKLINQITGVIIILIGVVGLILTCIK